jgi:hypothetical protein
VNEPLSLLLLFGIGVATGILNVVAGGGSALTLPALIVLGLESSVANGTNRVAILLQSISGALSFRTHDVHEFRRSFLLALWAIPGVVVGALLSIRLTDVWFQRILVIVMIGTAISLFIPQPVGQGSAEGRRTKWIYPLMFGVGFYGGFIQVSVGFLLMAVLYHVARLNLVYVNMHKVTVVLLYTIPAIAVFAWTGNVDWLLGLVLGAGSASGAWWGAHASVAGGEKLIRIFLVVAILIMAAKLVGVF